MITFQRLGHHGLLGNQMFQYATLFSVAKTNNFEYGVPYSNTGDIQFKNFFLPNCFSNLTAQDSNNSNINFIFLECSFEYNPEIFSISDNTDISGYFQTEKYFKQYRSNLLKEFTFSDLYAAKANDIRQQIPDEVISLHIRLGDYTHLEDRHPVCSYEYYNKAFDLLPNGKPILVFSDDLILAQNLLSAFDKQFIFSDSNCKYTDMCLMSLCDYHIIANSSFSWWGSWLSNSKKTIAPAVWFGNNPSMPKNWNDIYCENWSII
jgi:hypothetical protein